MFYNLYNCVHCLLYTCTTEQRISIFMDDKSIQFNSSALKERKTHPILCNALNEDICVSHPVWVYLVLPNNNSLSLHYRAQKTQEFWNLIAQELIRQITIITIYTCIGQIFTILKIRFALCPGISQE